MNRRRLLQLAGLAPLGAATSHAAYSPLPNTGKARFTPTLNAYSFLEQINANIADPKTGIELFGVCDFCVKHDIEAMDTGKYFTADPYSDIAQMVPHAVNWQIKETLGSSLKTPPTDFKKLAKIVHDGGYRGFVPIETLFMGRKDYDPASDVVKVLTVKRAAIAELK
jgi:hypothetical protein